MLPRPPPQSPRSSLRPRPGLPRCLHHLSTVPCPLPRRTRWVRASIASPSVRPSPYRWRVGIRIFTFEACSGFTHITARWIARPPKATFVTRLQCDQLPSHPARQLPDLSTTIWVDSPSTGDTRPSGHTAKSGKNASVAILSADVASLIRATILCKPLPHDAGRKPRLAPRRLDVLLQEAVRFLAGIAGPGIGPCAAFVVGGAGGLAGVVAAVAALEIKTLVVAAEAVNRGFDCLVAPFDHAGAAHAGDTAIALHPRRHVALEPAHRAFDQVGRIAEGPGPAAAVTPIHHMAF